MIGLGARLWRLLLVMVVLGLMVDWACAAEPSTPADAKPKAPSGGKNSTSSTTKHSSCPNCLGAGKPDPPVPAEPKPTWTEYVTFGAFVGGVLGLASINTFFKMKSGQNLPGFTNAAYMKEA
jgi:hypothetical protein